MEQDSDAYLEEEKQKMIKALKRCKIQISNYVYTIKIDIDREASPKDPRFCKPERSTYIPEPFATFMASLDGVFRPGDEKLEHGPFFDIEAEDRGFTLPEYDPYVFAILCGLRSMSRETEEYVKRASSLYGNDPPRRSGVSIQKAREGEDPKNYVWNANPRIDDKSMEAIEKGAEWYGSKTYTVSPFDRFDLVDLVRKFSKYGAKCNLPRFSAVILRTHLPSASCSIFAPKKAVNTGARTDGVGQYVVMKTLEFLRENGYNRACPLGNSFTAQNVVATFVLPFRVNLDLLCKRFKDIVSYNKDIFPGVRVRAPQIAPAAQLVFASGKVVTMGGRSPLDHVRALSATFSMYYSVREFGKEEYRTKKKSKQEFNNNNNKRKRTQSQQENQANKQTKQTTQHHY